MQYMLYYRITSDMIYTTTKDKEVRQNEHTV